MNDKLIETFLAVAEAGSYTESARKLYLTQPAVSYRIQTLEKELRVKLFTSAGTSVMLTPAGQAFLSSAKSLQQQFFQINEALSAFRRNPQQILLGFPAMMLQWRCNAFFRITQAFSTDPSLSLSYKVFSSAQECFEALCAGDIDITFTDLGLKSMRSTAYGKLKLFNGNVYVCMRRTHPLAQHDEISLSDLKNDTIIWFRDSTFMQEMLREEIANEKIEINGMEQSSLVEALAILQPSCRVVFSNNIPFCDEDFRFVPLRVSRSMPIGLIWKASGVSPELRRAIQIIADLPLSIWRI